MKFEDLEFNGKDKVKKHTKDDIYDILSHELSLDGLSCLAIRRYLDVLIDDQHYNPKTKVFYDEITNTKLNKKFLANIAHDYIIDNIEDFLL